MNETATDEIRALEARAEKAEAELLKDRNEGECYGPFHAGFLCEDCANRYRWLRARVKELDAGIFAPVEHGSGCQNYFGHCLHEWKALAEKAEAAANDILKALSSGDES